MAVQEDFTAIFGKSKMNGGGEFIGPAVFRAAGDTPNKMPASTDKLNSTTASDKSKTMTANASPQSPVGDVPGTRSPGDLGPLMDDPNPGANNTNDDDFLTNEKNPQGKDNNIAITMPDPDDTDGYMDGVDDPDDHGSQVSGIANRFGETETDNIDGAVAPPPPPPPPRDDKVDVEDKADFNNVKHLTQGMMDVALLSANANQLRTVLESSNNHPYYHSSIVLISLSLFCQIAVGITLIMDYQYHLTNQPQKAKTVSRCSMFGIFLIIIINVFIAAFSVATPVSYRPDPALAGVTGPRSTS